MKLFLLSVRSVFAILAGLFLISLIVETIEFSLVSLISDAPITLDDPSSYYEIRNQPSFLVLKIGYNALAAILGGYVCAWIAEEGRWHALIVGIIQTLSFVYAIFSPQLGPFAPTWMWITLLILTFPAIMLGSILWRKNNLRQSSY